MNNDQDFITKLEKLSKMHSEGHLTKEEFTLAKKKLLSNDSNDSQDDHVTRDKFKSSRPTKHLAKPTKLIAQPTKYLAQPPKFLNQPPKTLPSEFQSLINDNSIGRAANRYVTLQTVMAIISIIIFFIVGGCILSEMRTSHQNFQKGVPSYQSLP